MSSPTPILSGLRQRCGQCGSGKLFSGYLKLNPACPACDRDMRAADTADGPAFFVGFGVLVLLAPFLFLLPMSSLPIAMKALAFVALCAAIIGLCVLLLPVAKAVLLNLQLHHDAEQASFGARDDLAD
ncbi:DUF983 domain-containing protein [Hyphomonas johnsonii]|jgi:uncharacterized protein (DUF983 family)|uniref:DUF983 domain-containing protein n=1 Tax=Hyphomonas johnsonii MHS-2 TaxID=1280950 RepID=A0A059FNJ3_9PROT|nr:DUF983 domain-containing protein [Hyphomonas johnsonii]KCZ92260.1 hypothetical protein HJO_09504 [Hyphomonas johnsonii MHS-2]